MPENNVSLRNTIAVYETFSDEQAVMGETPEAALASRGPTPSVVACRSGAKVAPLAIPMMVKPGSKDSGVTQSVNTTEGRAVVPRASSGVLGEEGSERAGVPVPDCGGDAGDGSVRGLKEMAGATDA